jgi:hypothetical protein
MNWESCEPGTYLFAYAWRCDDDCDCLQYRIEVRKRVSTRFQLIDTLWVGDFISGSFDEEERDVVALARRTMGDVCRHSDIPWSFAETDVPAIIPFAESIANRVRSWPSDASG